MKRLLSAAAFAGAVTLALSSAAQAAGEDFCRGYTDAAIRQVNLALSMPRCAARLPNTPRWSTDRHVHWDWCRNNSRDAADAERDGRKVFIDHCRTW
jgi:hypothetical protein